MHSKNMKIRNYVAGRLRNLKGDLHENNEWGRLVRLNRIARALGDPIAPSKIRVHVCGHAKAGKSSGTLA
jgi:hypothetical protein